MEIIIIGAGSAGLLSALMINNKIPKYNITIIKDPDTKVIGVGESTVGSFITMLKDHIGINIDDFIKNVKPVTKHGLLFNFGKKDFNYSFDRTFDLEQNGNDLPNGFYFEGGDINHSEESTHIFNKTNADPNYSKGGLNLINKLFLEYLEKITIEKLKNETSESSRLTVEEYTSQVESITMLMNTALREIGMFQNMYDSIKKNHNIPDNWSEKDYELQEIEHMVRSSFRLAIQELTNSGRIGQACTEYWEQLGIHPQMGEKRTRDYLLNTQEILTKLGVITIQLMYDFLDEMVKEFGESYKLALKRTGLDELGSEEFMAKGHTKPQ